MQKSSLNNFLKLKKNSRSRESLINHLVFYQLKLAAANRGYDLQLFTPDVDRFGFDVILDDQDVEMRLQLKTILEESKTNEWKIHRDIIRPKAMCAEKLGFEPTQGGIGIQGGVLLLHLSVEEPSLIVRYFYTDISVITALKLEVIKRKPAIRKSVFRTFYQSIQEEASDEKITIPKSFFLESRSPEHLLALMGMSSRFENNWVNNLLRISKVNFIGGSEEDRLEMSRFKGLVSDSIQELVLDSLV